MTLITENISASKTIPAANATAQHAVEIATSVIRLRASQLAMLSEAIRDFRNANPCDSSIPQVLFLEFDFVADAATRACTGVNRGLNLTTSFREESQRLAVSKINPTWNWPERNLNL